jgi:hypothetical protein
VTSAARSKEPVGTSPRFEISRGGSGSRLAIGLAAHVASSSQYRPAVLIAANDVAPAMRFAYQQPSVRTQYV